MKKTLAILTVLVGHAAFAQPGISMRQLLDSVNVAVTRFNEGEYVLQSLVGKVIHGEDSTLTKRTTTHYFKKSAGDTLVGYRHLLLNDNGYQQLYDGINLYEIFPGSGTLEITDAAKYYKKIKEFGRSALPAFMKWRNLLHGYNNEKSFQKLSIAGTELVNGEPCIKISLVVSGGSKAELYLFVSAKSYLPVRQYVRLENNLGKVTEVLEFDDLIVSVQEATVAATLFTKGALNRYNREQSYLPESGTEKDKLPAIGTLALDWQLPLIGGGNFALSKQKGKVVIMDFWYRSCSPCVRQMADLQKLHERYRASEVVFIGINTTDDPVKEKLELVLANRNITMPSVYNGKKITEAYGIYASPALLVIDKNGTVAFTSSGYSESLLSDVAGKIDECLKK